jgi:hypothetical protein
VKVEVTVSWLVPLVHVFVVLQKVAGVAVHAGPPPRTESIESQVFGLLQVWIVQLPVVDGTHWNVMSLPGVESPVPLHQPWLFCPPVVVPRKLPPPGGSTTALPHVLVSIDSIVVPVAHDPQPPGLQLRLVLSEHRLQALFPEQAGVPGNPPHTPVLPHTPAVFPVCPHHT